MNPNAIQTLYTQSVQRCKQQGIEDADETVQFIIQDVFGAQYITLLAQGRDCTDTEYNKIQAILDKRIQGVPLAYCLNNAVFCGHEYYVTEGVLIPRPETEGLVEIGKNVMDWVVKEMGAPAIFECGVGSGVISIELAMHFPELRFMGWDISNVPIAVTQKNMKAYNVQNLSVMQGDFFNSIHNQIQEGQVPSIIVSNPPYVSLKEYEEVSKEVLREPKEALVASNKGLGDIFKLIELAKKHSAICLCEIGYAQKVAILAEYPNYHIQITKDLSGHDRYLIMCPDSVIQHPHYLDLGNRVF